MMISDHSIESKLVGLTLWPALAQGINPVATNAAAMKGLGSGTPSLAEIVAAANVVGLAMDAADDITWLLTQADLWNFDLTNHDILAEIIYASTGGAADTGIVWKAFIKGIAAAAALSAVTTSADGTITFATETDTGADAIDVTERQAFNVAGLLSSDPLIGVTAELDSIGIAAADEIHLICMNLYGTHAMCSAAGRRELT